MKILKKPVNLYSNRSRKVYIEFDAEERELIDLNSLKLPEFPFYKDRLSMSVTVERTPESDKWFDELAASAREENQKEKTL